MDAFNKLVRLGLKGLQQEEIVSVLIHCLLVYKVYNPFFAYVAQQLCQSNRKYQVPIIKTCFIIKLLLIMKITFRHFSKNQ